MISPLCENIICIIAVTLLSLLLSYITCLGHFKLSVYTWGYFLDIKCEFELKYVGLIRELGTISHKRRHHKHERKIFLQ